MIKLKFIDKTIYCLHECHQEFTLPIDSNSCKIRGYPLFNDRDLTYKQGLELIYEGKVFKFIEDRRYISLLISDIHYPLRFDQFVNYMLNKTANEIVEDSLKVTSKFISTPLGATTKSELYRHKSSIQFIKDEFDFSPYNTSGVKTVKNIWLSEGKLGIRVRFNDGSFNTIYVNVNIRKLQDILNRINVKDATTDIYSKISNEQALALVNSGKIPASDYVKIVQHNANKIDKPGLNSNLFTIELHSDWYKPFVFKHNGNTFTDKHGTYIINENNIKFYIGTKGKGMKTKKKTSEEILKEQGYKYSFHTFGKDRKITICIGVYKPFGITQIVNCGYAICRPNDIFNEHVAHLISSGRLAGEAQTIKLGTLEHKPSKDTIKGLAKDAYHYILDYKDKFFIESKTKTKKDEHKQSTRTNKKDRGTK